MDSSDYNHGNGVETTEADTNAHVRRKSSSLRTIWILLILLGLQNMAVKLMNLPLNRVIELRYCQQYYSEHDPSLIGPGGSIPERMCKLDSIQQKLAWMQGIIETLHIICDLFVTIPLSAMSDKGRRRLVLGLNVGGLALMYIWIVLVGYLGNIFPVGAMLFGPLFTILGGGDCAFMSTVYGLVTESASEETQRSSYFAYISSVSYVIALTSPSISARTMTTNLWLPFWIGIAMLLFAMPVILSLHTNTTEYVPIDELVETESLLRRASVDIKRTRLERSQKSILSTSLETLFKLWGQVSERPNFRYLLAVFLLASLASSNTPILPHYISKRYGWTFAEAGYLLSVKAAVNIVLLTLIVPNAIKALLRYSDLNGLAINMYSAKASLVVSVLGAILVATSTSMAILIFSLIVYAFGSAMPVFTLSLVKTPAVAGQDSEASAQDYSIVMFAKTLGSLLGLPLMTISWAKGIGLGGAGLGMPYFLSAIFYSVGYLFIQKLHLEEVVVDI